MKNNQNKKTEKTNPVRKHLRRIFLTYALIGSALLGTGYGLQTAFDHAQHQSGTAVVEQYVMPPKGLPPAGWQSH